MAILRLLRYTFRAGGGLDNLGARSTKVTLSKMGLREQDPARSAFL